MPESDFGLSAWGFEQDLGERRRRGLYRVRRRLQSAQGPRVRIRGREFLSFAANDYLGLAADPRLARAAARAARRYGCGAGASPLVSGYLPPVRALENTLAQWEGMEAALAFSSGYATNLGLLGAVASPDDTVFSDELNHASIIDGCRLARASVQIFRHRDVDHLAGLLRRHGPHARRRVIVTDTVFSMDGDLAPVADLIDLADRYDCLLVIDEAHATGVLGNEGRGLCATPHERVIKIGTLSKALGSQGGFICGARLLVDWLVNHARPYIFSTALAPPAAAAARRAVQIAIAEPGRRRHVLNLATRLRDRLKGSGHDVGASSCQIVPLLVGEAQAALDLSAALQENGLLVPAIRPPSVPAGTSRLRMSLNAGHTEEDVERLVETINKYRVAPAAR